MPRGLTSPLLLAGVALGIAMALGGAGAIRAIHRTEALVLGASLAAGLAVFAREARREPHEASRFAVLAGVVAVLVFGAIALLGRAPHPLAAGTAVASALAVLLAAVELARLRRRRNDLPDVLGERFGRDRYVEADGVQVRFVAPPVVSAVQPGDLDVWLQNTFDAERAVEVTLDLPAGSALVAPRTSRVVLGPVEVGVLAIPISAAPEATGSAKARIWIQAKGGGRRVRLRRATSLSRPRPWWLQGLALLAAVHNPVHLVHLLVSRGGAPIEVHVRPAPGAHPRAGEATFRPAWREPELRRLARAAGLGA